MLIINIVITTPEKYTVKVSMILASPVIFQALFSETLLEASVLARFKGNSPKSCWTVRFCKQTIFSVLKNCNIKQSFSQFASVACLTNLRESRILEIFQNFRQCLFCATRVP